MEPIGFRGNGAVCEHHGLELRLGNTDALCLGFLDCMAPRADWQISGRRFGNAGFSPIEGLPSLGGDCFGHRLHDEHGVCQLDLSSVGLG